ncbi:hypothetical protein [Curtobacterium sp. USHLN213]|uniref:hypothetical protein n=1 Tax=Curtobacterium sp. USHLN213 TaxID=3081255 RepID=UPI00301A2C27
MSDIDARPYIDEMNSFAAAVSRTTRHGVLCGCDTCWVSVDFDDDFFGKAVARAAEHDDTDPCD